MTKAKNIFAKFEPQPGPQAEFLSTTDFDFVLYGGAAGGGKSWALLVESLRHVDNQHFGCVIFRRTSPQITAEGGLWDESNKLYAPYAQPKQSAPVQWIFPTGATVTMTHMQHDQNRFDWQGSQIPLLCWDELTHFSKRQFFYMFSRNRSTCGVRPYIRATCNPVPPDDPVGGWVHEFVGWYIDPNTGYAIAERSGVIRWFVMVNDTLRWGESREELTDQYPGSEPKSFTFIRSDVFDNKILLEKDPGYLANLKALPLYEQEQLLKGNWLVKPAAGKVFNRDWFEIVEAVPAGGWTVRSWDLAASEKKVASQDPDFTADVKMKYVNGIYYVLDANEERMEPAKTDNAIKNRATQDGKSVIVRFEREGGASGKRDARTIITMLDGWDVKGVPPQGDKLTRAKGLAAQALAGNVKLLRGEWNQRWLNHMHGQPDLAHDDLMDASSGAYNELQKISKLWTPGSANAN